MEKILERKKRTNRGTDKAICGRCLHTQYKLSYQMFVPNFKILGQVVAEKFLTKTKFTLTKSLDLL